MNRQKFLRFLFATTLNLAGSGMLLATPARVVAQTDAARVPNEILVGVAPETALSTPEALRSTRARIESTLGHVIGRIPSLGVYRVRLRSGQSVASAVADQGRVVGVAYVEPNYKFTAFDNPNDPAYAAQQWAPQKVHAELAWPLWSPKAATVIAIVDTGVTLNHPDLENKLYRDSSGNVIGYDFVNGDASPADDHGHGTHCAGIAAAQVNNGVGMAGIAGWSADPFGSDIHSTKIMPVKVLDASGSGSLLAVANGITFAADNGAKIISLSLGATASSTTLTNAIAYAWNKGCIVVAAAGNSSSSVKSYPAACANVISVAATDTNDTLASFSNYGSWVLCAAPGVSIYSTYPGGYANLSGTSMAAPLVAGEAALLASQAPWLSNTVLRNFVLSSVDPYKPYASRTIKGGRVNVFEAIFAVNSLPAAPSVLSGTAKSRTQISLTWMDNSSNEANFVLERSANSVTFSTVATLVAKTTSYTNSSLVANTLYYYRIRAVNSYGSSNYSNTISVRTLP